MPAAPAQPVGKGPSPPAASSGPKHPKQPPEAELVSLISHVRDMFPDLGEGYVERALAEFDFSAERTVDALLENNVSPALAALDKKTPRGKAPPTAAPSSAPPAVSVVPTTDTYVFSCLPSLFLCLIYLFSQIFAVSAEERFRGRRV
jgi:hypothetical protein